MSRFLIFSLVCVLVIAGIVYGGLESFVEQKVEEAILQGYPGTEQVEVKLKISWLKKGLEGRIESFKININNWNLYNWQINKFQGDFTGVKINLFNLFKKKTLVVEKIGSGKIQANIDNENLQKGIKNYYPGFDVQIVDQQLKIDLVLNIFGKNLEASSYGDLIPGKGAAISFRPKTLTIAGYKFSEVLEEKVLKHLKLRLALEKIPFHFQVTTVKIMQDKILIKGKV